MVASVASLIHLSFTVVVVADCLVNRVHNDVGGDKKELVKSHYRLTVARFHSALRQVQKRVRGEGYGVQKKTNDVTSDLLSER